MKLENLNPFVRYANFHRFYEETNEKRICYDCRLFYILSGEGTLIVDGEFYSFSNNSIIYLPPVSKYYFDFKKPDSAKIYLFDFDLCDKYSYLSSSLNTALESNFKPERVPRYELVPELSGVIVKGNGLSMLSDISSCVDIFLSKEDYYIATVSAKIKLCLIKMISENENSMSQNVLINGVKEFIRANYSDAELDNSNIASHFNYHSYYLNRLMKENTGRTLHDYLLEYRIEMAKNLLVTTASGISAVADKTGFSSYSYFISRFKKETGLSPRKYRLIYKNKDF